MPPAQGPEKMPETEKPDAAKLEPKIEAAPAEKTPETTTDAPKVDVKPLQPAAPSAEKTPQKPPEKAADRISDRWERMASKVLERVGKDTTEEPSNTNR